MISSRRFSFLILILLVFALFSKAEPAFAEATAIQTPGMKMGYFKQSIDHFAKPSEQMYNSFMQRYWIDSEFASGANAPVIFQIGGENNGEQILNSMAITYAKMLKAHVITLEHRYYGQSQPYNDLSPNSLKFLTLENAIEDLANFQKRISKKQNLTGKWIAVGGSYAGTLAAIYRQQHPELVVGALASSAPIISKPLVTGLPPYDWMVGIESEDPKDYPNLGARQWAFEACTIFNFWLGSGAVYSLDQGFCDHFFGVSSAPDYVRFNQKYYYPIVALKSNVSHILFTHGEADPWKDLGITKDNNQNPNVLSYTIPRAGHCADFYPVSGRQDTAEIIYAKNLFLYWAKQWLK